jgi:hypothetical protein
MTVDELQSIKPDSPLYGCALQILARIGSLEWMESIVNTDQYTAAIRRRQVKAHSSLIELLGSMKRIEV